jgi:hypothetical protein
MSAMNLVTACPLSIAPATRILPPGMLSSVGLSRLTGRVFGYSVSSESFIVQPEIRLRHAAGFGQLGKS